MMNTNRIKAVKDLIFEKLDQLITHSEGILTATTSSLENDSSMLEAMAHLIQRNTEALVLLLERTDRIQQYLNALSPELVNKRTMDYKSYDRVEIELMGYLYSFLPSRIAVDIGANIGEVSEHLLEVGYQVIAFEPFPPAFTQLNERLSRFKDFQCHQLALGRNNTEAQLHIAKDLTSVNHYKDSTLYSSLLKHSMPNDLQFFDAITVQVRSLESLHHNQEIQEDIGLLKIDAEGFDLEIIRGMGNYRYAVVVAEYWDKNMLFALEGTKNQLDEIVAEMRSRGYHWHIIIHRDEGRNNIGFYCNSPHSIDNSWGNVFFFLDRSVFIQAMDWCSLNLPKTTPRNSSAVIKASM
jgi:FkbM family methyltransferase